MPPALKRSLQSQSVLTAANLLWTSTQQCWLFDHRDHSQRHCSPPVHENFEIMTTIYGFRIMGQRSLVVRVCQGPTKHIGTIVKNEQLSEVEFQHKIQCERVAFKLHCYIPQLSRHSKCRSPDSSGVVIKFSSPKQRITNYKHQEPNTIKWNSYPECSEFWNIKNCPNFPAVLILSSLHLNTVLQHFFSGTPWGYNVL